MIINELNNFKIIYYFIYYFLQKLVYILFCECLLIQVLAAVNGGLEVPNITDSKINTHVPASTIWDISQ